MGTGPVTARPVPDTPVDLTNMGPNATVAVTVVGPVGVVDTPPAH